MHDSIVLVHKLAGSVHQALFVVCFLLGLKFRGWMLIPNLSCKPGSRTAFIAQWLHPYQ